MCASGGIKDHKTNHSLRATAATEMFRCGAPEKLIQERTGHRSVEALRTYEHLEESQHKAVSSLLSNAGSSHLLTYQQHLSAQTRTSNFTSIPQTHMPQISLQNLKGCTINFNCMPLPPTTQITNSTEEYTETELDELFSLVDM